LKIGKKISGFSRWIDSKGFSALIALIVGFVLWLNNQEILAGISFGVFLTRNWDIFRNIIKKNM
tara:strand:- start:27 stop:218 length:192 start_codon:yes stop_codon:yes gene_type:complete